MPLRLWKLIQNEVISRHAVSIRTPLFTFEHPQDDIPVVCACSVEADCVIRLDGEGQRQGIDLAEGTMVPLCGHLWYCSQSWPDILLNLLN